MNKNITPELEEQILNFFLSNKYIPVIRTIRSSFPINPPEKIEQICAYCEFLTADFKTAYMTLSDLVQNFPYKQISYLYYEICQFFAYFEYFANLTQDYALRICQIISEIPNIVFFSKISLKK